MQAVPEPIAVIGSACRFPGGSNTPSKFWELLKDPRNVSKKVPADRFDVDMFYHPDATHHGTTNAPRAYFLEDDITRFDNGFFNIQPMEADAIDPQQRLLMETVYDALTAGGLAIEKLQGSSTAVYVGQMCDDWSTTMVRDYETVPTYCASGMARSIVSNRISYFFDWHGPSMTIDTACSSSLVAVHQAVQSLRSGESSLAVVAGTNLIFNPCMFVTESKLRMLSPNGRSAMWDSAADGYARGEGIATVVLKPLKQALADGDPIDCIVRETGVNQDGRTTGLTMPSHVAQTTLIKEAYERAGLDVNNPADRPQFFHAHGTGTQAGDPQEAEAISTSLFPNGNVGGKKLLVGSVKTIIGHTEGTAGVASLIATSLAMQNGVIPPNLHFNQLSPKVAPFYDHLQIPTAAQPWPEVAPGQAKRASINSFGFGGTNAHAIIESYEPAANLKDNATPAISSLFTPLVFSATSEKTLRMMLSEHLEFLQQHPGVNLRDLAWTLQERRSTLAFRKAVTGTSLEVVIEQLDSEVNGAKKDQPIPRYSNLTESPKILGVFTGQGAQWPRMAAELIEASQFAQERVADLDGALQQLPIDLRPTWTIKDQLLADKETSRIAEAALSQPLCTAVQIVLVDVIRASGVRFEAVVGHSSGEIGAAYAAGLISAHDAICTAYLRGVHAKKAASPNGVKGAMMAVGASREEASDFCQSEKFRGRLQVAAVNSSSSVTLSGDEDAIDEAVAAFKDEGRFARKLRVDTAYHSAHMLSCAEPYLSSLKQSAHDEAVPEGGRPVWFSSVIEGARMSKDELTDQYWVDNMCNTVQFSGAIYNAVTECGPFDLAIELGPHPALKGPATANIEEIGGAVPYTGLLSRGRNDVAEISTALGFIWSWLGSGQVDFSAVEQLLSGDNSPRTVLRDLPLYPFDHQRSFWLHSRVAEFYKHRQFKPNPILGTLCQDAKTSREWQWRNILRPREISWMKGHQLQGQIVFPASGYMSMAVEALKIVAGEGAEISCFRIDDLNIGRAIALDDEGDSIETLFNLSSVDITDDSIVAEFACYSVADDNAVPSLNAEGRIVAQLSAPSPDTLPVVPSDPFNIVDVDAAKFYTNLTKFGYQYTKPFQGVTAIKRKPGYATGLIQDQSGSTWEDQLVVHPGMLDTALQTVFAAWSSPGDGELWSLHVPTHFDSITINPYFSAVAIAKQTTLKFESFVREMRASRMVGDIHVYTADGANAFVQIEGGSLKPFTPASADDDVPLFSNFHYKIAGPDGELATRGERLTEYEVQMYSDVDRVAFFYVKEAAEAFPAGPARENILHHYKYYLRWCDRMVEDVTRGVHPKVGPESLNDTRDDIAGIMRKYEGRKDIKFVQHVGEHVVEVITNGTSMLEYMDQDDLLRSFYADGLSYGPNNRWLGRIVGQIAHRYPHINIFEIGAGTGATTTEILDNVGSAFSTFTYTDISAAFFGDAEELFKDYSGRMVFKTFDMDKTPADQGLPEGQYDVVVAANVLHVSGDMEFSMSNVRRLLKPGGYILILELLHAPHVMIPGMTVGTLPGWWSGAEKGRPWCPGLSPEQWDELLRNTGFSGIDTITPNDYSTLPVAVLVSQAVDDRIALLRKPVEVSSSTEMGSLAIVGGTTQAVLELSQKISKLSGNRFDNVFTYKTIEEFAISEQAKVEETSQRVSVLVLTDLDEPYMKDLTSAKFESLKTLWSNAGTLIWVCKGSRADEPYSYMLVGIGRVVKREYPNLNLQLFDLGSMEDVDFTAKTLSETLIRHHLLRSWSSDASKFTWSSEPEIFMKDGKPYIPRVLPDHVKNMRYNARRRAIHRNADPTAETLRLVSQGPASSLDLLEVSPLQVTPPVLKTANRTVRITQSMLQSLAVGDVGFLRLCLGIDIATAETVLALTTSTENPAIIPSQCCISWDGPHGATTLLAVAANLIAGQIIERVPRGAALLVNEPDQAVKVALEEKASDRNVKLLFTTGKLREGNNWIVLHPKFSQHNVGSLLASSPSVSVHFSRGAVSDAVQELISKRLPSQCMRLDECNLISAEPQLFSELDEYRVSELLRQAVERRQTLDEDAVSVISLNEFANHPIVAEPLLIVDWTMAASVSIKSQPIDSDVIFRADGTYFLTGMSGELGQSLCHWMIDHGARYVVLSSRTPRVSDKFIDEMRKCGATVRALPLDVTSKDSLLACHTEICRTMPTIVGVMNGAMVLQDDLFANMSYEQFTKVLRPKIEGTKLLDELFYDTPLDFFIVASSITSIVGQAGQSNYSAANTFMIATMNQRRKRGVPGSAMDIAAVVGIGYAAQGNNFDFEYFESCGFYNISEHDFQILFAEAIVSGRPDSSENVEVCVGVNYIPPNFDVKDTYSRDIKFSHYVLQEGSGTTSTGSTADVPVRTQLQSAKSRQEAHEVILSSFSQKLKKILQIPEEESVSESTALVEQGVDSLVAIDIRTWFVRQLEVEIPVLKVLGGSTISDLVDAALDMVPVTIVDISALSDGGAAVQSAVSRKPAAMPPRTSTGSKPNNETASSSPVSSDASPVFTPTFPPNSALTSATMTPIVSSKDDKSYFPLVDLPDSTFSQRLNTSEKETCVEMSFGQARFWFLHQFLKDKTPFNSSSSLRISGPLPIEKFERAVDFVVKRHEALHTRYFWSDGDTGVPMQGISHTPLLRLEKKQISTEEDADRELANMQNHVYDLETSGGMRIQLLTLSDTVHFLQIGSHHIALDGQSIIILVKEIMQISNGLPLEPMLEGSQYRAFSAFQRQEFESGQIKKDIDYFQSSITENAGAIELFPFAKVTQRAPMEKYRLHRAATHLSAASATKVKQLARRLHCTSFHVYLAILQAMIFRILPDTEDFFVGIADSNRVNSRFTNTVGCLVNLLPIKFSRSKSLKLADAVKATRTKVYGALEHSKVPFDVLLDALNVTRSTEYSPIFQVYMDYRQGDQTKASMAGCDTDIKWVMTETGYDVVLEVIDTTAETLVVIKLQESLYEQEHAELLLRTYVNVVEQFLRSPSGDVLLDAPTLWSKQDVEHAFKIGRGPQIELQWGLTLAHRVDEMIRTHTTDIALKDGHGNELTYAAMGDRINTIATELGKQGISSGRVVAVFQEPGADWMCSMLAILRMGVTYVPLDLKNGMDRLRGSVNVAKPHAILVDRWCEDAAASLGADDATIINVSAMPTVSGIIPTPNVAKPDTIAVILFTSGSTGTPKGIALPHSCLSANAEGVERAWNVGANVVLQQITLSFDFSLHQIFTALANGGTLIIVPSRARGNPVEITQIMLDEGVTHTLATPTEYGMWFQAGFENLASCISWKWALSGGEGLLKSTLRDFASLGRSGPKLYDFYGPIEATVAITKGEVLYQNPANLKLGKAIPTGHMLPNYSVYILNEEQRPVPVGVPGEIVVGGPGVAAGYLGLDTLTAEKFIQNPFRAYDKYASSHGWNRLYRTGDRGRLNEEGELFYEGRIDGDAQVKILGIRTELGEIESAIMAAARGAIKQAIVAAHGEALSKFLVAYVVMSNPSEEADARDKFLDYIRAALQLPQYLRPAIFIPVASIPMNAHGKTDRKALKSSVPLPSKFSADESRSRLESETERRLASLWLSVFPPRRGRELGSDSDFFHSGGNSMLLIKLLRLIKEEFKVAPRLIDLMNSSTLMGMAKVVQAASAAAQGGGQIDWRVETAIPQNSNALIIESPAKNPVKMNEMTVVLTGATGYIGKHLLLRLAEDSHVAKIICLVRDASQVAVNGKVSALEYDLGSTNLGLTNEAFNELADTADVILHLGANRAFWDSYEVLGPVNVGGTKELVRIALPRRVPLHFFSSGAARTYSDTCLPPIDGSDAYLASKWAAETMLREASRQLGLNITIHTPMGLPANTVPTSDATVLDAWMASTRRVGLRPTFDGFSGYIDLLDTAPFVEKICDEVFSEKTRSTLQTVEYKAAVRLDVATVRDAMTSNAEWETMPSMDMLAWTGEAKKNGLPYVLAAQEITISKKNGVLVSRR